TSSIAGTPACRARSSAYASLRFAMTARRSRSSEPSATASITVCTFVPPPEARMVVRRALTPLGAHRMDDDGGLAFTSSLDPADDLRLGCRTDGLTGVAQRDDQRVADPHVERAVTLLVFEIAPVDELGDDRRYAPARLFEDRFAPGRQRP